MFAFEIQSKFVTTHSYFKIDSLGVNKTFVKFSEVHHEGKIA